MVAPFASPFVSAKSLRIGPEWGKEWTVPLSPTISRLAETNPGVPFFARTLDVRSAGYVGRDYFKILLVTRGTGRIESHPADRRPLVRRLVPGSMLMLRPFDIVRFTPDDRDGLSSAYVSFSDADWRSFAGLAALDPSWKTAPATPAIITDRSDPRVLRPFELAIERFRDAPSALDLVHFLSSVAGMMFSPAVRAPGRDAPAWLTEAIDAMRIEANLRVGYGRLRELAFVSPSYLSTSVRRFFGTTPTLLVNDIRLHHAAALLAMTDDSVATIAGRCGFDNVPYFSTAFRRMHRLSPREYRSRTRGGGQRTPIRGA